MEDYLPEFGETLRLIPEVASTQAGQIDALYTLLILVSGLLIVALTVLVAWFSFRYRAGGPGSRRGGPSQRRSRGLELGWSAALLVVFLVLFWRAGRLYLEVYRPPADASLTINVIGKQWMWKAQHPSGAREINTLHVPRGQTVRLRLASQDVIHSFFVPAFRIKRDAVPETYTYLWFEATREGEYPLFCAEYCGTDHSRMRGKVVVMSPTDYQQWLGRNRGAEDLAARGARRFRQYGCGQCHGPTSTPQGPTLAGAFGRTVRLRDGGRVTADEQYLHDSILRPQKHVVDGYEPRMPTFEGQIPAEEILEIIAYIRELEPAGPRQARRGPTRGSAP